MYRMNEKEMRILEKWGVIHVYESRENPEEMEIGYDVPTESVEKWIEDFTNVIVYFDLLVSELKEKRDGNKYITLNKNWSRSEIIKTKELLTQLRETLVYHFAEKTKKKTLEKYKAM